MKVSIIVPIYNVEPYILDCLRSIICQTMKKDVECILVDDCGKDNSLKLATEFIESYKGDITFSICHHTHNKGLSEARNTGIRAAHGEYIYFLDSDDEILPRCIETMYSYIEKYRDIDLVEGSCTKLFGNNNLKDFSTDQKQIKSYLLDFNGSIVAAQDRLVKRELILNNNLYFKPNIIHEDNHWTFFLAKHIKSMALCQEQFYMHRYNPNSITNNINKPKEINAYKTLICDFTNNIDPFLEGHQKVLILNTLLTLIKRGFYDTEQDKKILISTFSKKNRLVERIIINLYFKMKESVLRTKILHLLIRIYKYKDK